MPSSCSVLIKPMTGSKPKTNTCLPKVNYSSLTLLWKRFWTSFKRLSMERSKLLLFNTTMLKILIVQLYIEDIIIQTSFKFMWCGNVLANDSLRKQYEPSSKNLLFGTGGSCLKSPVAITWKFIYLLFYFIGKIINKSCRNRWAKK